MSPSNPALAGFPEELRRFLDPVRLLGAGGAGAVFLARDRALDRPVAVKVLLAPDSPMMRERCLREAEALARLKHENILRLYTHGVTVDGAPYLVTEYLDGQALDRRRPPRDPLGKLLQVAGGLEAVHRRGLLHRDVKPGNIVLTATGRPVLVDFGLARDPDRTDLTASGGMVGTFAYVAPEVLRGEDEAPASDWYSWGVTLFALLERSLPYPPGVLLRALAGEALPPPPFRRLAPGSPEVALIGALLGTDPDRRPTSVAEVRRYLDGDTRSSTWARRSRALRRVSAASLDASAPAGSVREEPPPPRRGLRPAARSAVAIALALQAALVVALWSPAPGGMVETAPPAAAPPSAEPARDLGVREAGADPGTVRFDGGALFRTNDPLTGPPSQGVVGPFRLERREVTVARYARFLWETEAGPPPHWEEQLARPDRPVVFVSWTDAARFASWAGGRLPTRLEWEWAARGAGEGRPFVWGTEADPDRANLGHAGADVAADAWDRRLEPGGAREGDRTVEGIEDMQGNVAEWCAGRTSRMDLEGVPPAAARVLAGGSWRTPAAKMGGELQGVAAVDARRGDLGIRVAYDPEPGSSTVSARVVAWIYPAGTDVFDLGRGVHLGASSPALEVRLPAGRRALYLEARGYAPASPVLDLPARRTTSLELALSRPREVAAPASGFDPADVLATHELGTPATALAWCGEDGGFLAGLQDGTVVHRAPGGDEVGRARVLPGAVGVVACGEGGARWAAAAGGSVRVLRTGGRVAGAYQAGAGVTALRFLEDGSLVVGTFRGELEVYPAGAAAPAARIPATTGPVLGLAGAGSGRLLAGGWDGRVRQVELATARVAEVPRVGDEFRALLDPGARGVPSPDGRRALRTRDDAVLVLLADPDARPGKGFVHPEPVGALAALGEGRVASADWEGRVAVQAFGPGSGARPPTRWIRGEGRALALAGEGRVLFLGLEDGRVLRGGAGSRPVEVAALPGEVRVLAASDRGDVVVAAPRGRVPTLVTGALGRPRVRELPAHRDRVTAAAVAPGGGALLTGSWDGEVRWRDPLRGRPRLLATLAGPVSALVLAPTGWAAIARRAGELRVLDLASGAVLAEDGEHCRDATRLAVDPTGTRLACARRGGGIRVLEVPGVALLASGRLHADGVAALGFLRDGSGVVSGGFDGAVRRLRLQR